MSFAISSPLPLEAVSGSRAPHGRMVQLDGIRGLAVLGVLAWHWAQPYLRYCPLGIISVRVFFTLSGFLITGILLRARRENERAGGPWWAPVRSFYIRRVMRIFPLYYLVLAVILIGGVPAARQYFVWHLLYLSNFLQANMHELGGSTSHFWSLAVEEQFYLFWPWLVLFMPRRAIPWMIVGMLVIGPVYRLTIFATTDNYAAAANLPFACLDSLGAGALLAWSVARGSAQWLNRISQFCLIAGLPLLALGIIFYCANYELGWITITDLGVGLTAAWLIFGASRGFGGVVGWFLMFPPLIYLGTISYCVYILHPFIHNIVPVLFGKMQIALPRYRVQLAIELSVTVGMATASWYLFERHMIRLGRMLTSERRV
jgi:peptidoglycan/LPS O-acetylase OafA/YrhL